jgi:hypothetical protein
MSVRWSTYALEQLGLPDPGIEYEMPDLGELVNGDNRDVSFDQLTANFSGPRNVKYFGIWVTLTTRFGSAI